MKIQHIILSIATAFLFGACTEKAAPSLLKDGDTFTVTASFSMPGISAAGTKAMGDAPDYAGLRLYIAEFDLNGAEPLENYFTRLYTAENEVAGDDRVTFSVTLDKTVLPKVLHLIAVQEGVVLKFDYGSEGSLIPSISVSAGNEAYWQRIELPGGYGTVDADGKWTTGADLKEKLTMVPMIRNFARIRVENRAAGAFALEGFAVVNVPDRGTVAPWNSTSMRFPEKYISATPAGGLVYDEMSYEGVLPPSVQIVDTDAGTLDYTTEAKYIYERPYNSINHTLVIVKGSYAGGASSYYKVDIGRQSSDTGVFSFYSLLRNFDYVVSINSVSASGYPTADEALHGVVYNNFSFDVETRSMLNISDGTDMMWVNFTTAVVTQDTEDDRTLTFRYRYKTDIETDGGTLDFNDVKTIGLETGEAIESVSGPVRDGEWMEYTIRTVAPGAITRQQSFILINSKTGLGRTINIIVRNPWLITRNRVFAGNYNLPHQFPYDHLEFENKVSHEASRPLTVFFTIPNDLPEAIFPLSFEIEADRQNIENNPIGTLVVTSGSSLFPGVTGLRIKYLKTVTWADYNAPLDKDHMTGTIVSDLETGQSFRRIRARFRTITSLANLQIAANGTTETIVRISNPYFRFTDSNEQPDCFFRLDASHKYYVDGAADVHFVRTNSAAGLLDGAYDFVGDETYEDYGK